MRTVLRGLLVPALLALTATGVLAAPSAGALDQVVAWCTDAVTPADHLLPCVESASVDGVPFTSSDPHYGFLVENFGLDDYRWNLRYDGAFDLPASELGKSFTVVFNVHGTVPDAVSVSGTKGPIARTMAGADHLVTITSTPVTMTNGCTGSDWPLTCPSVAPTTYAAVLQGAVSSSGVNDAYSSTWGNLYGFFPPEFVGGALVEKMSNAHFASDGTTVFVGHVTIEMTYAQISALWGVDDPTALLAGGITGSVLGGTTGTVTVTNVPADHLLRIDVAGVTFSNRQAVARAVAVTPKVGAVTRVYRTRVRSRAVVVFKAATSRGSKVRSYQARCVRLSGSRIVESHVATVPASRRAALVSGLLATRTYYCQDRAVSRAGASAWSARVRLR